jgi:hypothetical protein
VTIGVVAAKWIVLVVATGYLMAWVEVVEVDRAGTTVSKLR